MNENKSLNHRKTGKFGQEYDYFKTYEHNPDYSDGIKKVKQDNTSSYSNANSSDNS